MPEQLVWQVLYIDDDSDNLKQIKELLDGMECRNGKLLVTISDKFDDALDLLGSHRYDLVILDVRLGPLTSKVIEEAGAKTLRSIQAKQFIPVIFYTALPSHVADLASPLVKVIEKTAGAKLLPDIIRSVFDSLLPIINRALINHMETIQKEYMWDFVAKNWGQLSTSPDHSALAYLLARRLAVSLSERGIEGLIKSIGGTAGQATDGVHPMQYYVMPPINADYLAGDIFQGKILENDGYWVLLSPSCDLVSGRVAAEHALFAKSNSLSTQKEYQKWKEKPNEDNNITNLKEFMANRRKDRYFYLPAVLSIPDLVVDLQALATLPFESMNTLKRIASLDSPYAEALLNRFSRYFGRLGVPDLDVVTAIARLSAL